MGNGVFNWRFLSVGTDVSSPPQVLAPTQRMIFNVPVLPVTDAFQKKTRIFLEKSAGDRVEGSSAHSPSRRRASRFHVTVHVLFTAAFFADVARPSRLSSRQQERSRARPAARAGRPFAIPSRPILYV